MKLIFNNIVLSLFDIRVYMGGRYLKIFSRGGLDFKQIYSCKGLFFFYFSEWFFLNKIYGVGARLVWDGHLSIGRPILTPITFN